LARTPRRSSCSTCTTKTCTGAPPDIGWVTGHSYGRPTAPPRETARRSVMYEGRAPTGRRKNRFLVDRRAPRPSRFLYNRARPPSAAFHAVGAPSGPKRHDLSSLRLPRQRSGSRSIPKRWVWVLPTSSAPTAAPSSTRGGRRKTGMIMITHAADRAGVSVLKPGSANGVRFPAIAAEKSARKRGEKVEVGGGSASRLDAPRGRRCSAAIYGDPRNDT